MVQEVDKIISYRNFSIQSGFYLLHIALVV